MLDRVSSAELTEWLAWFEVEAQDREKAEKQAAAERNRQSGRGY